MMARRLLGPIIGLLFGLFVAVDLIVFGVIAFESALVLAVLVLGLALGAVLGFTTPLARKGAVSASDTVDTAQAETGGRHDDSASITSDGA